MPAPPPLPTLEIPSETSSPERRRALLAIAVINLVFLAVDLAVYGGGATAVWGGRLLVTAALLAMWRAAGRELRAGALRARLTFWLAATMASFALIVIGSGAASGPYLGFYPLLPMVAVIVVPDEPVALLVAGAITTGVSAALTVDLPASQRAMWLAAAASTAFYPVVSAVLYRRMRWRERAAAAAREAALAALARAQQQRAQAERLASVGRLAAGVAHEINNPLAFVGTNLAYVEEEVRERHVGEQALLEALAESRNGLERIKRIVQDLRGFVRGAPERGPCDVAGAVEEALRLTTVRLAPVARVERRLAAGLPPVAAGRGELVQVLVNLLANAADALDEAGRGPGRVVISAEAVPGGVRLAVEDDGVGLPPGEVAQLFEPFFTTKGTRGTGLGLAISRELAGRWGAQLAGEARAGGGARFTLVIRTAETAEAAEAVPPRP